MNVVSSSRLVWSETTTVDYTDRGLLVMALLLPPQVPDLSVWPTPLKQLGFHHNPPPSPDRHAQPVQRHHIPILQIPSFNEYVHIYIKAERQYKSTSPSNAPQSLTQFDHHPCREGTASSLASERSLAWQDRPFAFGGFAWTHQQLTCMIRCRIRQV